MAPPKGLQRSLNGGRDAAEQAAISLSMLQDERRRRLLLRGATAAAVLAAVVLTVLLRRGRRAMSAEELRLAAALGTPEAAVAAEQARAAKLLGVRPDAPRQTVEEALAAQLSARDPSRLVGLPLQLQRVAEEQRQALIRARDCLLRIAPESVPSRRGLATAANGQSESS